MAVASQPLDSIALHAWRSFLQSHAAIVRELDAELVAEQGMTSRDYEVLLYLDQAEERRLPMSQLADRTMLTRSGVTRLIDGLVTAGLVERTACESDARIAYAQLTEAGLTKLKQAGCTHIKGIQRMFLEHFDAAELETLASLLGRLPGATGHGACTASQQS